MSGDDDDECNSDGGRSQYHCRYNAIYFCNDSSTESFTLILVVEHDDDHDDGNVDVPPAILAQNIGRIAIRKRWRFSA